MRPPRKTVPGSALLLLTCGLFLNARGADFKALTKVDVVSPSAADCGKCHIDIYHEWVASPHANSYVSEGYRDATRQHDFDACAGCHAPATVFAEGIPKERPHRPEEGVTCLTCHLRDGAMAGPVKSSALVHPHPISIDRQLYYSSALCGKCHVGTLEESVANGATNSCQECHMPAVFRKVTQAKGGFAKILVAFEDPVAGRKHGFSLHDMDTPTNGVSITLSTAPGTNGQNQAVVTVAHALPHGIPTGDYGVRRATLLITARDSDGQMVASHEECFYKELDTALQPGRAYVFNMSIPHATHTAEAQLFRTGRDGKNRMQIAKTKLVISDGNHAVRATE